ncbi:GNAT family acetyltransferase [Limobrevibacterium gyesilva]|uniref:GNAT family acetyltransferase n=1 Tax=Limobrevibacterium gyesilva TaxID=2991712 RepID=A0AA42CEC8_9PROT|nr:GNAT family acetyltransferase [Limobrevibacterium gyesilva]MCW3475893.1 GNAT family acetyltransferase [Limobrevibacterium gyesilva]
MGNVQFRSYAPEDFAPVIALWQTCGLHPSRSDSAERLQHKQQRDPELFLVAEQDGRIVGTIMGSYDGRRGWINKLAVDAGQRGQGLARALIAEVEQRLKAIGCDKVNLLIEADNAAVAGFYARLGYANDALIFMEKWLA